MYGLTKKIPITSKPKIFKHRKVLLYLPWSVCLWVFNTKFRQILPSLALKKSTKPLPHIIRHIGASEASN